VDGLSCPIEPLAVIMFPGKFFSVSGINTEDVAKVRYRLENCLGKPSGRFNGLESRQAGFEMAGGNCLVRSDDGHAIALEVA